MIEDKKKPHGEIMQKDWARTIAQHVAAWVVLIGLSMWLWSMIKPVMPLFAGATSQKESSETAIGSQMDGLAKTTSTTMVSIKSTPTTLVKVNKPAAKAAVAPNNPATIQPAQVPPTTTTTMFPPATANTTTRPTVVNGLQILNPLANSDVNGNTNSDVRQLKIIVNGLNVRAMPSGDGAVVGALKKNEVVKVLGYQDQWLYIETNGNLTGFIKSNPRFETPVN
jgi:hypothetical protein